MKIAIDIDGVLNYIEKYQLEHAIPWFKERGYDVVNPNGFDIKDIFGCSEEVRKEFWKSTVDGGKNLTKALIFDMARNSEMRPGFKELLEKLNENGDTPYIITERYGTDKNNLFGMYSRKLVYDWLESNGINFNKENIIFVPTDKTKKDIYKEKNIDIILEDNVENIKAIEEIDDLYAVIFNASYNANYNNEKAYRVDLPIDAYEKIKEIEKIKKEKKKLSKILRPDQFKPETGFASKDQVYKQYYAEGEDTVEIPPLKMVDYLRERANNYPDAILIEDDYGHKVTYREFIEELIPKYAKALANYGVKKGDLVVIALPNVIAYQAAKFAANDIGAIPVMANPLSSVDEFSTYFNLEKDGKKPHVMLMFNRSFNTVKEALKGDNELEHIISVGVNSDFNFPYNLGYALKESKNDPTPKELKEVEIVSSLKEFLDGGKNIDSYEKSPYTENETAVIYFTGGTTGTEKASECTNENAIAIAKQFGIVIKGSEINDLTVNAMPWFHVFGDNQIFYFAACQGMTNYPVPKFNRKDVNKMFKHDIVNYNGVPAFLLATYLNLSDKSRYKNIKKMISGGAALSYANKKAIDRALKLSGSEEEVEQGYGITEGAGGVCYTLVGADEENCIGIPTPGTEMKIVDPKTGEELGYDQEGEICFSGPSVMKGYLNNPEETAKSLHVSEDGKIWFHTGDLGKTKANGLFYFSDRIKRMIIVSGENVYPNRIEKQIIDNFGDIVDQCFIIAKKDEAKGEVPVAKILLKEGVTPSIKIKDEILSMIKNQFKNKKYWPTELDFIKTVPLTKMSKADYKKLSNPDLIIDIQNTLDNTKKVDRLKDNYNGNRFYKTFSDIYSPIYSSPILGRKITYVGEENFPEKGAAIITLNHLNAQDQNVVLAKVDRIVSLPSKKEYFDGKLSGWFMKKMEMIPVDRYGDTYYARDWIKGILNTQSLDNFEVDNAIIKDIINYIDSIVIGPKAVKNVKELVTKVLEYIETNYEGKKVADDVYTRISDMPTTGTDYGYGRTLQVNDEVFKRLNKGNLVAVFPEGTRNDKFTETGMLLPFHRGAVHWARDSYAPIIPTAVTGEHKRGGELLVRTGEPIKIDSDLSNDDLQDATNDLQDRMYKLVLQNLVEQETEDNTKALINAIKNLKLRDDQKSKELLDMISNELMNKQTERNSDIIRRI